MQRGYWGTPPFQRFCSPGLPVERVLTIVFPKYSPTNVTPAAAWQLIWGVTIQAYNPLNLQGCLEKAGILTRRERMKNIKSCLGLICLIWELIEALIVFTTAYVDYNIGRALEERCHWKTYEPCCVTDLCSG